MKKIIAMAFAAVSLAACNDGEADNTVVDTDTTTTTTTTTTDNAAAYTPAEGDVTYREKKVMVYRNGQWVETEEDVRLENGVVVSREGKVTRDGKEIELEEGEVVNRTGNFFDKTGRAIENAWDTVKVDIKDAGQAVEKGAKKVGKEVKDAVTDDDDNQ